MVWWVENLSRDVQIISHFQFSIVETLNNSCVSMFVEFLSGCAMVHFSKYVMWIFYEKNQPLSEILISIRK